MEFGIIPVYFELSVTNKQLVKYLLSLQITLTKMELDNYSVMQQPSSNYFKPIIDNSIPGLEKLVELIKVTVKLHFPNPFHCENFEYILLITVHLMRKVNSLSFSSLVKNNANQLFK